MKIPALAAVFGVAFGFLLAWAGMSDPDAIRRMLLLEEAYLYLVMFSSVAVAFAGLRVLRRARARALVTGEPVSWTASRPERRHVVGSVVFGAGWALSSSCPGPIAAQLGQGVWWSAFTIAGIAGGVALYARRQRATAQRSAAVATAAQPNASPIRA